MNIANPEETAEDRWEFNQQSEALYQARRMKEYVLTQAEIDALAGMFKALSQPLTPATLDGLDAPLTPKQSGESVLPFVSQVDEE